MFGQMFKIEFIQNLEESLRTLVSNMTIEAKISRSKEIIPEETKPEIPVELFF